MSGLLIIIVIIFKYVLDRNVIDGLLTVATYTYGPLLGLFSFGIFTRYHVQDRYVWIVALISVLSIVLLANVPADYLGGYVIGYELLPINGLITFIGLYLIRKPSKGTNIVA